MKPPVLICALIAFMLLAACSNDQETAPSLVPQPVEMVLSHGQFRLASGTRISW